MTREVTCLQEANHDFYGNMKLYDPNDRESIEWGLQRVFDYDVPRINAAVADQVLPWCMCNGLQFILVTLVVLSGAGAAYLGRTSSLAKGVESETKLVLL